MNFRLTRFILVVAWVAVVIREVVVLDHTTKMVHLLLLATMCFFW